MYLYVNGILDRSNSLDSIYSYTSGRFNWESNMTLPNDISRCLNTSCHKKLECARYRCIDLEGTYSFSTFQSDSKRHECKYYIEWTGKKKET